jgi:hypothetical protein
MSTSTTEAELLALSQVAKELDIRLDDHRAKMLYDHTQAIRIVNQEIGHLFTKLQHVNTTSTISVWWPSPPSKKEDSENLQI